MTSASRRRIADPRALVQLLGDPDTVVIEVTNDPNDRGGPGTIAGSRAVYWKWLLWHPSDRAFADAEVLADRLARLGAGGDARIVLAGAPTQFAAYALWVYALAGVGGDFAYLDGGVDGWIADGLPTDGAVSGAVPEPPTVTPERATVPPVPLTAPRPDLVVGRTQVRAAIGSPVTLVDVRTPAEFQGVRVAPDTEPIDHGAERHGHIPGAVNLPIGDLLDEYGRLLPDVHLRDRLAPLADSGEVYVYCRLSHRAALAWLVIEEIGGDQRVRVYDGSWTEWGSIVGYPVELPAAVGS
ncbi:sulfurtransferase [Gordonia sinesedis]